MTWWHYLILVNFYLVLFYGFYVLLLQKETFFQLNRLYLVAATLLSFFIPLMHADWVKNLFITRKVQYSLYGNPLIYRPFKPIEATQINLGQVFLVMYISGILFLSIRLLIQLIQLNKVIHQPKQAASYSFFNRIKLGDNLANRDVITAHEQAHAQQWHSVDVLIIEIVMIINWFNPVVYFYRLAIKHIHEFIADKHAIRSGTTKAEYALLLLSQTFNAPAHQLVNNFFNKSLLKRRILMLQKGNSKNVALTKYGLSAPLFILMLILSSATITSSKTITIINKKAETVFSTPAEEAISGITNSEIPDELPKDEPIANTIKKITRPVTVLKNEHDQDAGTGNDKAYTSVEKMPEFPGGLSAFYQFISKTINYPSGMRENNIQGKAFVSFVIETDGSISNVKSLRDPGYGSGEEAVRTISLSPKWNPALQNGQPIRVQYTVPINFSLAGEEAAKFKGANTSAEDTVKAKGTAFIDNEPLVFVNGREYGLGIKSLNPNNIQSIYVLKGKKAEGYVTMYGDRAANGVMLVTLKK